MNGALRFVVSLLSFVATFYFVFWMGGALLMSFLPPGGSSMAAWVAAIVSAVSAATFVWQHTTALPQGLITSVLMGAFVVGAIGFVGGFFGPIIFTPDANQGPLLGLLITGPLGFLLGGVGGA